jgi:hypothetical protein
MNNAEKIKTYTPILPEGTGPTGTNLNDALFDIFSSLNEENLPTNPFSDNKIYEMIRNFIDLTGMNDWMDGEYVIFNDYKLRIKHMSVSELEKMPEFEGY